LNEQNNPARGSRSFLAESSEDAMKKIAIVLFLFSSLSCLAQGVNVSRISPSFINNTCMADQQAGADEGAKIAACNAALAPYGGIIDATGFQGTQYASTGFTLGSGLPTTVNPPTYSVTLKLGYVTLIAGGEIKMSPFSSLIGQGSSIFGQADRTTIIGNHNQLAVIDMTGCAHCTVENVALGTENPQTNSIPKTGITIARNPAAACTSGGSYPCALGNNTIRNVSATGMFQNAAFYAVESELLTLEHFYGYVYDSNYYPGGVKPKYCMAFSQTDVLGLGLVNTSTMTMGSIENSACWYYPAGVSGSAAIYFGGGNRTQDWSFKNVYLTKSNLGSFVEIQTNEGGSSGNLGSPLTFDNVDGETDGVGGTNYPNYGFYIHGPGASPQVNQLTIKGATTMGVNTASGVFINATANLADAYIYSQNYMNSATVTNSFATVWNSTIALPFQNTTIVNALASTLEGGANSGCGKCGLTVTGTNTSIVEHAYSTGSIKLNSPAFVSPSFTGTMAGATYNSTGGYQLNGAGVLITDGFSTYIEPVVAGHNVQLLNGSCAATQLPSGPFNANCGLANNNGTLIPSSATGNTGISTGKVSLVPGTEAFGFATLSNGTITVNNAAACSPGTTCIYKLTNCGLNSSTEVGTLTIGAVSVGTSFIINSESTTAGIVTGDKSFVCWQIN
jgi:hypothetical protein